MVLSHCRLSTAQSPAMTTHENWDVVQHPHQQVITMASHLRDFARMNPSTFYKSMVKEHPQEFIDDVYLILLAVGLSKSEKVELATYNLKDVEQAWIWNGGIKVHLAMVQLLGRSVSILF